LSHPSIAFSCVEAGFSEHTGVGPTDGSSWQQSGIARGSGARRRVSHNAISSLDKPIPQPRSPKKMKPLTAGFFHYYISHITKWRRCRGIHSYPHHPGAFPRTKNECALLWRWRSRKSVLCQLIEAAFSLPRSDGFQNNMSILKQAGLVAGSKKGRWDVLPVAGKVASPMVRSGALVGPASSSRRSSHSGPMRADGKNSGHQPRNTLRTPGLSPQAGNGECGI